ncbi:MAG: hypothetical protein JW720_14070 [Sedimentisphaerales bacterium]|nr:hypothetical protein [Sedimentisphaerales bacterium]
MVKKKSSKWLKRGSVMALVLFAVVLLLFSGVGVLSLGQTSRIFSIRTANEIAARTAADAGLTRTLLRMNNKLEDGWDGHLPWDYRMELPGSDTNFTVFTFKASHIYSDIMSYEEPGLIDYVKSATPEYSDYVIMSIGRCGTARQVIYGTVRLQGRGDTGVLVRDAIILKNDTLVDARDSRDPTNLDPDIFLEIGTISTDVDAIVLNNGVTIDGNVVVGVGGVVDTVIKDLGADTGLRYPMIEEPEFPLVYPPALFDRGAISAKGETITIGPAQSGRYDSIRLKNSSEPTVLIIEGGDVVMHITGDIDMGEGCEIRIAKGSSLEIYVDGDIKAGNSMGFNNLGTPPDLKLWGNWRGKDVKQDWELKAKSEYFGQLYAPNADVIVKADGHLYGAFTAESFEMKSGGNLYYDGALQEVEPDDQAVRFVLKRWYEQ